MNLFNKKKSEKNEIENHSDYEKIILLKNSYLKINTKNKIIFLDQLSNLLNSGIPITNSLKIISYQTRNKKVGKLIDELIEKTNQGLSLKSSFSCYSKIFSNFDLSIIEMGEVTGKIGASIDLIKNKEEKDKEIKGKIIGALIYPTVIITLSTVMIFIFMLFVIPKIQDMYKGAKVNLPALTTRVINTSNFLQNNLIEIIIGIICIIILFLVIKTNKVTKLYFDKYTLKVPLFGGLIKKKILSLFSSSLGTLLGSGIIINTAIDITSNALENAYYEKEMSKLLSGVSKGIELSTLMGIDEIQKGKENPYFPIELASVIKIGEQTGRTSELLLKISNKFNKEIDEFVKNLQVAIEPIVIIGVGLIVGTIIMAIMLPFFNMVNVI